MSDGVSKVFRGVLSKPYPPAGIWNSLVFVPRILSRISGTAAPAAVARDAREMPTSIGLDEGDLAGLLNDGSSDANFADKFVGDEAVRQISDALASNCSKTRVFLDRNCVGADGAAALGDMLKVWKPQKRW